MEVQKRGKNSGNQSVDIKKFLGSYGKYVVLAVLAVILIIAIVVISGQQNKPAGSEDGSGSVVELGSDEKYIPDFSRYDLEKNAYPEINALYETYYEAMKAKDIQTLSNIVDGYEFTQEEVDKESEYVEDYRNISCYTLDGLLEDTYIVYVYHEVKFYNIDTWAPGLYGSYVCRNEDGSVYIQEGPVDGEVAAYIDEMDNSESVRDLNEWVDQALADAQAQDTALDNLVKMLQQGADQNTGADEQQQPQTTAPDQSAQTDLQFEKVDETVYATQNVNIRKTPSADGEKAGSLAGGASIQRVGYHKEWSQVKYNGQTCYIKSEYLTKVAP